MVFPQTRLPVEIYIAPGASSAGQPGDWTWSDITNRWRIAGSQMTIDGGRGNWGAKADAGTCSLLTDNRSGDLSERNPLGQWYGQLGKNTPLWVRLRRAEDAFARTVASGWGSTADGQLWSLTGAGGSVLTSDWSVAPGVASQKVPAVAAYRYSYLGGVSLLDAEVLVDVDLTFSDVTGNSIEPGNVILRRVGASEYYLARVTISAAEAVSVSLHANLTGTLLASASVPGLVWTGQPIRVRAGISGDHLYMRVWDPAGPEPTGWQVEAFDDAISAPGNVGIRSGVASGNTNAKPIDFRYSNFSLRTDLYGGWVPSWMPKWDKSGKDRTVDIKAKGALYRTKPGSGKPPSRSALRRAIMSPEHDAVRLAYYPCEDGKDALQAASAIPGRPAMRANSNVVFGAFDPSISSGATIRYGSAPLPNLSLGGSLTGGTSIPGTSSPVAWTVAVGIEEADNTLMPAPFVPLRWRAGGRLWEVLLTGPPNFNTAVRVDGVIIIEDGTSFLSFYEWRVQAVQVGANVQVQLLVHGDSQGDVTPGGASPWTATISSFTLGWPSDLAINPGGTVSSPAQHVIGQASVWDGIAPQFYSEIVPSPWFAGRLELAHDRIRRLLTEDGIACYVHPIADADGVLLQGQAPGTPKDLYDQCEDSDGGVLYERPFGLGYRPQASLYSQNPILTLSMQGDLADPPEPDPENQNYRNQWTVKRTGGSEAVAQTDEVAAGAVLAEDSIELPLSDDTTLLDHAGWRLHLATFDDVRWPKVVLDLAARPQFLDAWLNARPGDRVQVINPLADVAGQPLDGLLEGSSVEIVHNTFKVTMNLSPAAPWDVSTADGDQVVAADGSALGAGGLTNGGTSFLLTSTAANKPWVAGNAGTMPDDYPMLLRVGGEMVEASQITGTTSPQTVTLSGRGLNGVTRAWPAGTPVDVWYRPTLAQ